LPISCRPTGRPPSPKPAGTLASALGDGEHLAELAAGDAVAGEASALVRERVLQARETQLARCGSTNARLDQAQTDAYCRLVSRDSALLERAVDSLQLSARSLHRILRVARTIADLAGAAEIQTPHLTEAIGYRRLERGRERAAA